jgi:hypothetical protein
MITGRGESQVLAQRLLCAPAKRLRCAISIPILLISLTKYTGLGWGVPPFLRLAAIFTFPLPTRRALAGLLSLLPAHVQLSAGRPAMTLRGSYSDFGSCRVSESGRLLYSISGVLAGSMSDRLIRTAADWIPIWRARKAELDLTDQAPSGRGSSRGRHERHWRIVLMPECT